MFTREDPADIPKMITIAPGLHVRQAVDNIAWIDMGGWAIVVDALERPGSQREAMELEREVLGLVRGSLEGRPVRFVLNTHTHYDHVALNEAFAREFGAEIVNADVETIPPQGKVLEGPSRRATMIPMPGCHTQEDCIIWVQPDGVLFVGDIFGWGLIPLTVNLRRETSRLLVDTYTRLIELKPSVVVPGHGPLASATDLRRWLEYFSWLKDEVARACAEGLKDKDIIGRIPPPLDMRGWWRFLKWKHADCLAKVVKSTRKGWLC